jgi:hypothetical protein
MEKQCKRAQLPFVSSRDPVRAFPSAFPSTPSSKTAQNSMVYKQKDLYLIKFIRKQIVCNKKTKQSMP